HVRTPRLGEVAQSLDESRLTGSLPIPGKQGLADHRRFIKKGFAVRNRARSAPTKRRPRRRSLPLLWHYSRSVERASRRRLGIKKERCRRTTIARAAPSRASAVSAGESASPSTNSISLGKIARHLPQPA